MGIRLIWKDGTLTGLLSGEIDHHTAKEMREEIDGTVEKMRPERLVLDFSEVQFMDSSGIGLIMGRYKLMQALGGRVVVANMPEKVERIVSLAGLDKLAKVERGVVSHETEE